MNQIEHGADEAARLRLYCYRTRTTDSDGDPLDWGIIRAETREEAVSLLAKRFRSELRWTESEITSLEVRLFENIDSQVSSVLSTPFEAIDMEISIPASESASQGA